MSPADELRALLAAQLRALMVVAGAVLAAFERAAARAKPHTARRRSARSKI